MVVTTIVGFILLATLALFGIGFIVVGVIFRKLKKTALKIVGTTFIILGSLLAMPAVSCTAISTVAWLRIHAQDNENKGPLLRAIDEHDLNAVKILVSEGADVNAEVTSYQEMTPLGYAASSGETKIAEFLIHMHADVNKPYGTRDDQLPLFEAIRHDDKTIEGDNIGMIAMLLKRGATPGLASNGENALHHAVRYNNNPEVMKLLLKYGVDINQRSTNGYTALMIPTFLRNGQTEYKIPFAKLLIALGAKVNIQDTFGKTALDHAEDDDFNEMSKLLRSFGAKTGQELRIVN